MGGWAARFANAALALFLVAAGAAHAQQATKPLPRVAYVYLFRIGPSAPYFDAFSGGMKDLGWVDGKTVQLLQRDANGDPQKLAAIMRELVDARVDIIVASCTPEAIAAKSVTTQIPVVVAATGDPVKSGLVTSWSRPGGNITGVSSSLLELSAKRIEILKEVAPKTKRATVLWNPRRGDNAIEVDAMQHAATALGMELQSQQVRDLDEIEVALHAMSRDGTDAMTETGDPSLYTHSARLLEFASRARLPAIYDNREFVDAGGLISYGPNLPALHRRSAIYVDKILKGAKPADLPFEQPSKFELVVNLRTARAQGIDIPNSLLVRADDVIR